MVFYISVHHTEILPTSSLTANCKTSAFRGNNLGKTKVVLIFCWDQPFQPEPVFVGIVVANGTLIRPFFVPSKRE